MVVGKDGFGTITFENNGIPNIHILAIYFKRDVYTSTVEVKDFFVDACVDKGRCMDECELWLIY